MLSSSLVLLISFALPSAPMPQGTSKTPVTETMALDREALAAQVKKETLHAWEGYKRYAWGHDELQPLTLTPRDWYAKPLLITPVDSLDTLILMGFVEQAKEAETLICTSLSFDSDISVKGFEINIRLLGGLLSSYQLTGNKKLLELAEDLGNRLLPAFNSPTGMPYMYVNLKTGAVKGEVSNPAEIGTYLLEFGALSRLTGKPIYYEKAKRATTEVFNRRSPIGLVGESINVKTGVWTNPKSHISGMIDSYYEYLLKAWRLFGDEDCGRMWKASLDAINRHLAHETPRGLWYAHVDMNSGKRVATLFGALDAFFPAVLALSGDMDRAKLLQESCYLMWTTFGIEPEEIDYVKMQALAKNYVLRPENIESAYYLFSFTKDPRYLEMGKTYLDSLVRRCRTKEAYAALEDVTTGRQSNRMESFFLAETMKYLYLIFAPPETLDLSKVVFTTEAHPLRRTW